MIETDCIPLQSQPNDQRFSQCHHNCPHPMHTKAYGGAASAYSSSMDQLPDDFLRQLALALPIHAKLQLRQCCHRLLDAVGATGIKLRLPRNISTALVISSKHVRALDVRALQTVAQLLPLFSPPHSYPHLQELSCHLSQLNVLDAVSVTAGGIVRLQLSGHRCDVQSNDEMQQVPGE